MELPAKMGDNTGGFFGAVTCVILFITGQTTFLMVHELLSNLSLIATILVAIVTAINNAKKVYTNLGNAWAFITSKCKNK